LLEALERAFIAPDLEEHLKSCESCAEIRLVAGALLDDRAQAMAEAAVPSAGTMWWRMLVRHRLDAEAAARRPLMIGQAVTLSVAIGLIGLFFGSDLLIELRKVAAAIRLSTPLLLALGTWLLVAPIAGWVAIRQK
jgi:hypothetical protein